MRRARAVREKLSREHGVEQKGPPPVALTLGLTCLTCDRTFRRQRELDRHIRRHDPSLRFKCPTCGHHFCDSYKYRDHQLGHSRGARRAPPSFVCLHKRCGSAFYSATQLRQHQKTSCPFRKNVGKFKCHFCPQVFGSNASRATHTRACRQNPRRKRYPCPICGLPFPSVAANTAHQARHTGAGVAACRFCLRTFQSRKLVRKHQREDHPKAVDIPSGEEGGEESAGARGEGDERGGEGEGDEGAAGAN
jgi:hypothetical protein